MPGRTTPRPRTVFRKVERWFVGAVMSVMAFVLERMVLRSIRKGGGAGPEQPPMAITSKGGEVDMDPEA
jgi:hypothetical protein